MLGMSGFMNQLCATLSTGQRQRVNLARALVHRPSVVLLDEPTLGLDVVGSKMIADYVEALRDQGKAVILCTHRLDDAERLCGRFGLMNQGKIVSEGTLAELRERTGCDGLVDMFLKLADIGPQLNGSSRSTDHVGSIAESTQ
jgi:ABC-2 type transport system ATP-binding protein/sodium transport system ATP-binding protein